MNVSAHTARVEALAVQYRGSTARLLQPAVFRFGDGVAVDRLRIGLEQAVLDVAGRVTPNLNLRASLRGVTPALLKPYMPQLDAVGTLGMDAKLSGIAASPQGTIRVDIEGLRMRSGAARRFRRRICMPPPTSMVVQRSSARGSTLARALNSR